MKLALKNTPGYGQFVLCTRGRKCCSKPHVQKIPATILYYLLKAIDEAAAAESLEAMVNARLCDLDFAALTEPLFFTLVGLSNLHST